MPRTDSTGGDPSTCCRANSQKPFPRASRTHGASTCCGGGCWPSPPSPRFWSGGDGRCWRSSSPWRRPRRTNCIAWTAGDNTRTRRLYLSALEQRAADLQRERDQRDALAVAAERARISRELHDVVAHGVSVMVVQAQAAAAAQKNHPDITAKALRNVVNTGRASLAEMCMVLGLVRRDAPQLDPQPGVGALPTG